jgi:DNA-binding NarL/FixJ family response regulator
MTGQERERLVELKIAVPLSTYRLLQSAAEGYRVPPSVMAAHQLINYNDPGPRKRTYAETRQRVFELWRRGLTGPQIAKAVGRSLRSVNNHKKAIRENWNAYQMPDRGVAS